MTFFNERNLNKIKSEMNIKIFFPSPLLYIGFIEKLGGRCDA